MDSVINLDNITGVEVEDLSHRIGVLSGDQDRTLTEALIAAFDLAE